MSHQQVSLASESESFLSKVTFLNQFSDESMTSFNLVLPGDVITREPGYIQYYLIEQGARNVRRERNHLLKSHRVCAANRQTHERHPTEVEVRLQNRRYSDRTCHGNTQQEVESRYQLL